MSKKSVAVRVWDSLNEAERRRILRRSEEDIDRLMEETGTLLEDVRRRGDAALLELAHTHDNAVIPVGGIRVTEQEFERAEQTLPAEVRDALSIAIENARNFHEGQLTHGFRMTAIRPGVLAGERVHPIDSVGIYVPRGRGSFPSMLYMAAVPARIASVPRIAICTPALPDGSVDPACLVAARLCGIHEVYRTGGPGAIAALAYGTETIAPVRKILGPGSARVTAAKRLLATVVDVGIPAGPTESMIIADKHADPVYIAADLMNEAEHGADSQALLLTPSASLAEAVMEIVPELMRRLPPDRAEFVQRVLNGIGGIIITRDLDEACEVANLYAPEHLMIQTEEPWVTAEAIANAGEILLGPNIPFSMANYATGVNAILPTGGWARTWGSISVHDFTKRTSIVDVSKSGFAALAPHTACLADYEGFPAHATAVRIRMSGAPESFWNELDASVDPSGS
ncbi:MAG: histidinol dehydrogenase [Spirochaetaceae bacterium]